MKQFENDNHVGCTNWYTLGGFAKITCIVGRNLYMGYMFVWHTLSALNFTEI